MTPETDTPNQELDTEHAEEETTTEAESERSFTQAEVDALIKQRLDRDRRKRRTKSRKQTTTKEKAETSTEGVDEDPGAWRDRFYDTIHGLDLTRAQMRKMRADFRRQEPTDPDAWVDEWSELFGISASSQEEGDEEQTTPEETKPKAKPVSDKPEGNRGAPQTIPDYDTVIDPNRLTADDIRRMIQKYGEHEAGSRIRKMVETHYRGRKVVMPS